MLVPNPSGSLTILRCVSQGEISKRIKQELKNDEIVEIRGYLRNEKNSDDSRQILVIAIQFEKIAIQFEKIDKNNSNKVRLLGRIITDLEDQKLKKNSEVLSFKLASPREGMKSPLFFCRAHGELVPEINKKLKKGDIIILEGFLQTKKIEGEIINEGKKKFSYISSIICYAFTFLDNDGVNFFDPIENLIKVEKKVNEIDFNKPKII